MLINPQKTEHRTYCAADCKKKLLRTQKIIHNQWTFDPMSRTVPVFFTFLYVLAMLKPVMPVFEYVINQDYIAEYLCINKDKPEMDCNGKCYLMQKIQKENEEKKQNLPAINLKDYPIGFVNIISCHFKSPEITKIETFDYLNLYNKSFFTPVFHPPNC